MLLALLGCAPDATGRVTLAARPGVRDLHAASAGDDVGWSWTVDGAPAGIRGPDVPATYTWPGQVWEATARGRGGVARAAVTVPEPLGGNVLVVMLDDVGLDLLAAYGAADPAPTPTIDALAAEGVAFRTVYGAPTCSPARAVALTGRFARRSGVGWLIDMDDADHELPLDAWTLPEALGEARGPAPWTAEALGKWHLAGYGSPSGLDHPLASGFSRFAGSLGYLVEGDGSGPVDGYFAWRKIEDGDQHVVERYATTDTVDDALARTAEMPEPFLLWLALHAPHAPHHVPPAMLRTLDVAEDDPPGRLVRAALEAADTELGRLLASMAPEVRARTTVVLTSDNGTTAEAAVNPARAKGTVSEGGLRVPLIVAGPAVVGPGRVSEAPAHLADLFPTVCDLAGVPLVDLPAGGLGVPLPDGEVRALDGESLLPWLLDPDARIPDRVLYGEGFAPAGAGPWTKDLRAVRDDQWKLVRTNGAGETFHALPPGATDEGEPLQEPLPAEADAARARLARVLDGIEGTLAYEGR